MTLPKVAVIDLVMPKMDGIAATAELQAKMPKVKVLILTSFGTSEEVSRVLAAGACGVMLISPEMLKGLHVSPGFQTVPRAHNSACQYKTLHLQSPLTAFGTDVARAIPRTSSPFIFPTAQYQ